MGNELDDIRQNPPESANAYPAKPLRRWRTPVITSLLGLVAALVIRSSESIEANFRWLFAALAIVLTALVLLVWFAFFSGLRWRTRLVALTSSAFLLVGLFQLTRFDGSADGSAFPRIVWKWTPKRDGSAANFQSATLGENTSSGLAVAQADYPEFLGSKRDGVVEEIQLQRDWIINPPQQLWRQPIGLGWSAFAVAGSRAVTQEQRGEDELVVCYQLATGKCLWIHTNRVHFSERMGGDGPRATTTIMDGRVYSLGATGILDCLDLCSGRVYWTRDMLKERNLAVPMFGKASSPLVFGNLVVITGAGANGPSLLACRRSDGAPVWQSGTNEAGYSSPTRVTVAGREQILSLSVGHATGHDPSDGHILWDYYWKAGQKTVIASQPLLLEGDRVFLSAGFFGAGCALLHIMPGRAGQFQAEELWKSSALKTHFSTAMVRNGFAYGLDDGILACIDLSNGKRRWKDGRYGRGQVMRISDLLLIQTEPGPVVLVEANPNEFREIARLNALNGKTWNNPAVAGEFLLVRNDQEAACYRLPLRKPESPSRSLSIR